jgi:hypothetical protein
MCGHQLWESDGFAVLFFSRGVDDVASYAIMRSFGMDDCSFRG